MVTETGVDALEAARDIADAAGKEAAAFINCTVIEAVAKIMEGDAYIE